MSAHPTVARRIAASSLTPVLLVCLGAAVGAVLYQWAPAPASAWLLWGPLLAGALGGCTLSVVSARFVSRSLLQPLEEVSGKAMELAKGKFGVQAKVAADSQLAELVQTFNYMSSQLYAYTEENQRLYGTLEEGYLETIVALANSLDSKDPYTRGHSQRVGELAAEIGRELKLPESELRLLRYGGLLHDIGKIGIVESILHKRSRLTDDEMTVMREHPMIGDTIVGPVRFLNPVRAAVRFHHERFDGTGYPDQLKGEDIPLIARVVACADTYDACTSTRPYQEAMSPEQALRVMDGLRGKQLDPRVLAALEKVVARHAPVTEPRVPVSLAS